MLLTAGRLIKYDLKELFKKHIALYIVTLLAAFGCWALHMLSEYVPDNGITPVAYPVMICNCMRSFIYCKHSICDIIF